MRGRKPKPVEQRRREGNPGHRPLPKPLELPPGTPVKPDDLPQAGSELWDEIVVALTKAGVAHAIDAAALTALCVEWARAEQARAVIREKGMFSLGSTGQVTVHPAVGIEREAHSMFLRFAEQYGLTAAARARIAAAKNWSDAEAEQELAQVITLAPREV